MVRDSRRRGVSHQSYPCQTSYIPGHCRKCGIKNEGQIIKNGSQTKVQLLPYRATKTELRLVRTRFYCKECQSTFNAQTNLVDENCYLSKELKVQIALELAKNTTRKEIADRYFVSDVTVLRVLHTCQRIILVLIRYLRSFVWWVQIDEVLQWKNEFCFYEWADPAINRCIGESSPCFQTISLNSLEKHERTWNTSWWIWMPLILNL